MNENVALLPELKTAPAVFAVGGDYQIMVPVKSDILFWVTVGGKNYYDHSNGIIRSSVRMHRVNVPMKALDAEGEYTVTYRKIIERLPYFSETEEPVSATYSFKPVRTDGRINIYHISDAHGNFDLTSAAGKYFGEDLDLLILNGDIPDHSGEIENFDLIYELCAAITGGGIPCLFSRGNHDTRGFYAENIAEYTPTRHGQSYFTFRLGRIWGIVMDCGEDKPDDHPEYGNTVCCHAFREEETEYLHGIVENARKEYLAPGVEYRLVVVHNPFTYTMPDPFGIELETYGEWTRVLRDEIKPQLILSGHLHETEISHTGGKYDSKGQPCPVIIGSTRGWGEFFAGCAVTFDGLKADVRFTNDKHELIGGETLDLVK